MLKWIFPIIDANKTNKQILESCTKRRCTLKQNDHKFVNLALSYCRQWFIESYDILEEAVQSGRLLRIIKLFDKENLVYKRKCDASSYHYDDGVALNKSKAIFDAQDDEQLLI